MNIYHDVRAPLKCLSVACINAGSISDEEILQLYWPCKYLCLDWEGIITGPLPLPHFKATPLYTIGNDNIFAAQLSIEITLAVKNRIG